MKFKLFQIHLTEAEYNKVNAEGHDSVPKQMTKLDMSFSDNTGALAKSVCICWFTSRLNNRLVLFVGGRGSSVKNAGNSSSSSPKPAALLKAASSRKVSSAICWINSGSTSASNASLIASAISFRLSSVTERPNTHKPNESATALLICIRRLSVTSS